ncbi:MAG: 30S ribosome-binding factor RbfA [Bradymonadaceae bacterium]
MGKEEFDRADRVGQKLQEILGRLLLRQIDDPRLRQVEITDVELSPDLRNAKVYFVLIGEDAASRDEAAQGLEHALGYIKREVADRLDTKYVPEIDFRFDETLEEARRIEEILDEVDTD